MNREEIAQRIADEGWCPESDIEYDACDGGYVITKRMFISDTEINAYIAEMNQCAAEEKADAGAGPGRAWAADCAVVVEN